MDDLFIESRAEEFEVIKELYPKSKFINYLEFCWAQKFIEEKKSIYHALTLEA